MRITRGALYLLFAEVGFSLIYLFSDEALRAQLYRWFAATTENVWLDGKVWTLVTGALWQPDFITLVFHILILWMFVPTLERWWGTKKFLLFALYTSLAGTVVGTAAGFVLSGGAPTGLDPFIYGSIVAFGVLYADHPVQFFGVLPMTGKQLMFGIIGFVLLFIVLTGAWAKGAGFAAAMLTAWLITSGRWNPRLWFLKWKQQRIRRHLKVVDKDGDEPRRWMN